MVGIEAEARAQLAAELREEARVLLVESGLLQMLGERFGETTITGSAGYDLMVWRNIDIHLPCDADRWHEWAGLGGDVARTLAERGLTLYRATVSNDYIEPTVLGSGFYCGLELRDFADNGWRCDLWGWDPFDFAVRQARDANLRADLAGCDRDLILALKHEARARHEAGEPTVGSFEIYQFVIAGGGITLDECVEWLAAQH